MGHLLDLLSRPKYITPAATPVVVSEEEAEPTGPVLAEALPFPVLDEVEVPAICPAQAQFDQNIQRIVAEADPVSEEAADRMPTHATQALTGAQKCPRGSCYP